MLWIALSDENFVCNVTDLLDISHINKANEFLAAENCPGVFHKRCTVVVI